MYATAGKFQTILSHPPNWTIVNFFMVISKECQLSHWKYHKNDCRPARLEVFQDYSQMTCHDAIALLKDNLIDFSKTSPLYTSSNSARDLLVFAEHVQDQHEKLELEIDTVMANLRQTFIDCNLPIPDRTYPRYKRLAQLKSMENLKSLLDRCQSSEISVKLESIKECRKLLSGEYDIQVKL